MTRQTPGLVGRTSACIVIAGLSATPALDADPLRRDARTWTEGQYSVTFDVPETYGDCRKAGLKDTIFTQGVPDAWRLTGRVNVGYVRDGQFVLLQSVPVEQSGNLQLEILYPPHKQIAAHTHGVIEYHVEPQIEVYDDGGRRAVFLGGDLERAAGTLGPGGQDWDVFCHTW